MRILLIISLVFPLITRAQTIEQKADALMTAYAANKKFSGVVLIAKDDSILFQKAYGYADQQANIPNELSTEFRIASLSKMFTSTAIMQLAEAGKLSIEDPVSLYFNKIPNGSEVRIKHLLSHTSGINGSPAENNGDLQKTVASFVSNKPAFAPGEKFQYNNFNYVLLSYIVEKVSKMSLQDYVHKHILSPLQLEHTGFDQHSRASKFKSNGYITDPKTGLPMQATDEQIARAYGAGAMYSNIHDLFKWSQAVSSHKILSKRAQDQAISVFNNNYGFGWMRSGEGLEEQVGHTGMIRGFIANFMKFPNSGYTIIFLSNYQDINGSQLSDDLKAVVFNKQYSLPVQKKVAQLDDKILSQYVGEYKLDNGFTIHISLQDNKLFALAQGDAEKIELTPESNNKFFLKGPETEIEFLTENNAVTHMFVNMQGGMKFKKVAAR